MTRSARNASLQAAVLNAFALAFRQLSDRALVMIFVKSLAITLALFVAAGFVLYEVLDAAMERAATARDGMGLIALLTLVLGVAAFWLAFRAVAVAVIGLFGDQVVQAVERRNYPQALANARPVPFVQALLMGLKSVARLVGYNLLALPLYLATAATGIGLPVAFFAINGWLLGRDLGDMVAARHIDRADLQNWRARTRWQRFLTGLATSGLFVVPVVNLIAPIVGAAAMTHLFHRAQAKKDGLV